MEFLIGVIFGAVIVFCLVHKPTRQWIGRYLAKQRAKRTEDIAVKPKKRVK